MSPHLQVYRLPLAGMLSIGHRITGAAMAFGALIVVAWFFTAATGPDAYGVLRWFLTSWIGVLAMMGFSFAFCLHLCNGVRHLVWDLGYGLDLEQVKTSNYLVLGAAAVFTLLLWLIGFTA